MSALVEIASEDEFGPHIASIPSSALVVLYFHAPWAAPCAQMRAVLSALASQYPVTSPATIAFVSVNAEELPDVSEAYDVTAVPYVVLLKENKVLETISGSEATRVRDAVERYAGSGTSSNGALGKAASNNSSIPPPLTAVPREDAPTTATQNPVQSDVGGTAPAAAAALALTPEQSKEALFARLAELVKAAPVMLFMKGTPSAPQCGFSRQLVGILRERSVKYGFFNILADEDVRQGLKEFADWPTFPQLWVDGELVGGLDIVKEELENDPDFLTRFSVNK